MRMAGVEGPGEFPLGRLVRAHRMCLQLKEDMDSLALHAACSRRALDCNPSNPCWRRHMVEAEEWYRVEATFNAAAAALQPAATMLQEMHGVRELGPADELLRVDMDAALTAAEAEVDALTREPYAAPPEPQRHHVELCQLSPAGQAGDAAPSGDAGATLLAMLQHHQQRELAMLAPAGDAEGTTLLARMEHGLGSSSGSTAAAQEPKCESKSRSKGGVTIWLGDHPARDVYGEHLARLQHGGSSSSTAAEPTGNGTGKSKGGARLQHGASRSMTAAAQEHKGEDKSKFKGGYDDYQKGKGKGNC